MAKTLIVGAGGLIGTALSEAMGNRHAIKSVRPGALRDCTHTITIDLGQPIDPEGIPHDVSRLVFLAQSRAYRDFPAGAADMFSVNVRAVNDLLRIGVDRQWTHAVIASTGGVYAPSDDVLEESSRVEPATYYARTRFAAETLALGFGSLMKISVIRPFFVYGPGQPPGMLIPRLHASVRDQQEIGIDGAHGARLSLTYVDDAVAAIASILDSGAEGTFNITGPDACTIRQIADTLGRRVGREPRFADTGRHATSMTASSAALADATGFRPTVSAEAGLSAFADWAESSAGA